MVSRKGVERTLLNAITRNYHKHGGQSEYSGEASGREDEEGLYLDDLTETNLQ